MIISQNWKHLFQLLVKGNGFDEDHVPPIVSQASDKDDTEEDDDDFQWQTDTSVAAARQHIQDHLSRVLEEVNEGKRRFLNIVAFPEPSNIPVAIPLEPSLTVTVAYEPGD